MQEHGRHRVTTGLIAAALAGAVIVLQPSAAAAQARNSQAKDPLIGTWQLDITQSSFTGAPAGAPPFRREMTFERVDNGIKHTTITRDALGGVNPSEYTAKFDGKDYPAPAESALDTNTIRRVDANTIERTGKIKGQMVETVTYAVSADGKTLTVTQKGSINGIDYGSVQVFTRKP